MTTLEIAQYYANLLIMQYVSKPKAYATIKAYVTPVIMDQLPTQVQDAFDPATAIGVQLDTLGEYVGITRTGYTVNGPVSLNDDDYRQLLLLGAALNTSNASLASIQYMLFTFFPGQIYVFDNKNMILSYMVPAGVIPSDLLTIMLSKDLLPRPLGVALSEVIYPPTLPVFGFKFYGVDTPSFIKGFNEYGEPGNGAHWLTYDDVFVI